MIHVTCRAEPKDFENLVRKPGLDFLQKSSAPSWQEWNAHRYWSRINQDLYKLYNGVCAYTGQWFPLTLTDASVDHFLPKSKYPKLAYEWTNYRLTTIKINRRKDQFLLEIDPFRIKNGWFQLDIPSCLLKPNSLLSEQLKSKIKKVIDILKLNDDDRMVQERADTLLDYANGNINFEFLKKRYPFLAFEIARQNLKDNLNQYFL